MDKNNKNIVCKKIQEYKNGIQSLFGENVFFTGKEGIF